MSTLPDFMHVADIPTDAAVALESTVISHGLPYPHNIQLALRLEEIVRAGGAAPATIGIIAGTIVVGLDRGQIEHLATAPGVRKVSRRDLPIVVARQAGRRDHRCDDLVGRAPGRHPGLRHGRDRGRSQDRSQGTGVRGQESGVRNRNLTEERPASFHARRAGSPASNF